MSRVKTALAKGLLSASILVLGTQVVWSSFSFYRAESPARFVWCVFQPGQSFKLWLVQTFDLPGNGSVCLVIVEWWHQPLIVAASLLAWAAGLGLLALVLPAPQRSQSVAP